MPLFIWLNLNLEARSEILKKFRFIFVEMMTSKSPFEINWPLRSYFLDGRNGVLILLFLFFLGSGRHSVITPFPEYNQQPGSEGSGCQLAYKFMDLGSCSGGLNRRETAMIFTLEDSS